MSLYNYENGFDLRTERVMDTPTFRTTALYKSIVFTLKLNFYISYTFVLSTNIWRKCVLEQYTFQRYAMFYS